MLDMPLFQHQLAPFAFGIGFLMSSFEKASDSLRDWMQSIGVTIDRESYDNFQLKDALIHLQPLTHPSNRHLLTSTASEWIAYFHNGLVERSPTTIVGHLCERIRCQGISVCYKPQTWSAEADPTMGMHGEVSIDLYSPLKTDWLNLKRSISLTSDCGEWEFTSFGEIQSFEVVSRYDNEPPEIKFTLDLLEQYCQALGIQLFDQAFYGGKADVFIDSATKVFRSLSLLEARHQLRLE